MVETFIVFPDQPHQFYVFLLWSVNDVVAKYNISSCEVLRCRMLIENLRITVQKGKSIWQKLPSRYSCETFARNSGVYDDLAIKIPPKQILVISIVYLKGFISFYS